MSHPLQCRCGTLKGTVNDTHDCNRIVCYCKDCQAFAHFLGRADEILDERGGSDVVQVLPRNVKFSQGIEALACIRLTQKGLVRWYASCCNTPIGNTLITPKLSFIGIVSTCLQSSHPSLDDSFGPVVGRLNTESAKGEPNPKSGGFGAMIFWFLSRALKARLNGDYKRTQLFDSGTGAPVATPRVLSSAEHENLMKAVS
jgi:hypothetical protein